MTVSKLGGLDRRYRIYEERHFSLTNNTYIDNNSSSSKNESNRTSNYQSNLVKSELSVNQGPPLQSLSSFLPPQIMTPSKLVQLGTIATMHKMPLFPEYIPPEARNQVVSANSLEISRNITKVLENLLLNYDSNQRPGHGGEKL